MKRYLAIALVTLMITAVSGCSGEEKEARESDTDPEYTLLLDDDSNPDQVLGAPGAYAMTARGDGKPPLAVVDVPEGYKNFGFFALVDETFGTPFEKPAPPAFHAINYWTVHGVRADPCTSAGPAPQIGTSVADLADALAAQKLSTLTEPVPVTLDGHDGLYLELSVPSDIDPSACDLEAYVVWEGKPGDAHHVLTDPGAVERLWILDVDGSRVVLGAITTPGVTGAKAGELKTIVESVRFVPA